MNLQEQISRIKQVMGLLTEDQKNYENKPIVFVGTAGSGKSIDELVNEIIFKLT
jgi:hypothetical protein